MRARPAEARSRQVALPNLAATEALARRLAKLARPCDVIGLAGDLGAGKTTLARYFIAALGGDEEVPSPTFSLVQIYDLATIRVWHLDLYRLNAPADAFELGIEDAFSDGISLIEWPDRLGALLPDDRLEVRLSTTGSGEARRAELVAHGTWRERIEAMVDDG
jgi:tRNA threonylcarbamoyladenosine biosynthesis protein TsaE